jgi:hypothetical protein
LKLNFGAVLAIIAIAFLAMLYFFLRLGYALEVEKQEEEKD